MHAQIAPEAFDRVFLEIAVAAEQLQRIVDHVRSAIGGKPLGHGGEARFVGRVVGNLGGGEIEKGTRRFQLGRHVGEHELGVLEIGDLLAELLPLLGVFDRFVEAALRTAQGTGADIEATAVEPHHRKAEAFAFVAHPIFDRHARILEDHLRSGRSVPAELLFRLTEADAGRVLVDDKAGDTLGLVLAGADHGDIDVVKAGARNELLGAVEDVMVTVPHSAGLEARRIRSAARFGEGIACDLVHGDEVGKVLVLHVLAAELVNHPARHIVDRDERAGRGTAIGHRLHDQRGFEAPQADAARFLADIDRAEAEFGRPLDHVDGKMAGLVPFPGMGRDVVGSEALRHFLNGELVGSKLELSGHGRGSSGGDCRWEGAEPCSAAADFRDL